MFALNEFAIGSTEPRYAFIGTKIHEKERNLFYIILNHLLYFIYFSISNKCLAPAPKSAFSFKIFRAKIA